jgi:hypothetical protein
MGTSIGDAVYSPENFGGYKDTVGGLPPQTYIAGQSFDATVVLDADHNGEAQWQLCPHSKAQTEECFRSNALDEWTDVHSYWDASNTQDHWKSGKTFPQTVQLPSTTPAGPATLRWLWICKYTDEIFTSCIDVNIVGGVTTPPTPSVTPTPTMANPGTPPPTQNSVPSSTPTVPPRTCYAQVGNTKGATDDRCSKVCAVLPEGAWPCNGLCMCSAQPPSDNNVPAPVPPPSADSSTICTCEKSTTWDGDFNRFVGNTDFCKQGWASSSAYVSAGGGNGASGSESGEGPCQTSQYEFTEESGWTISMKETQANGVIPYRAFAYMQFCNGQPMRNCLNGDVDLSFSFQTRNIRDIGAYVKILFWTDSGNILGLVPLNHPKGDGKYRLVTFIQDDYPNHWSDEVEIRDREWYRIQLKFKLQTNGIVVSLSEVGGSEILRSEGVIPVNMLAASTGPQLGIYSFDFGKVWPSAEVALSFRDMCLGSSVCTVPM